MARTAASYEHIDPQSVGNERRILVSELSGRSNIMALAAKHKIAHDPQLMDAILAKVVSQEHAAINSRRPTLRSIFSSKSATGPSGRTSI